MAYITTEWFDNTHHVLVLHFHNGWQWDDLYSILSHIDARLDTVHHPVTVFVNVQTITQLPLNIFKHGKQVFQYPPHPNFDRIVIIGANRYLRAIYRAFEAMIPALWIDKWHISFADSFDDITESMTPLTEAT